MSESKTYVFGNEGSGQGGMMSLLAPHGRYRWQQKRSKQPCYTA